MRNRADLQNSEAIKSHIGELISDYSRTKNPLVIKFINEWQEKYKLKIIQENERFSGLPTT